jgi:hypothetical protein
MGEIYVSLKPTFFTKLVDDANGKCSNIAAAANREREREHF